MIFKDKLEALLREYNAEIELEYSHGGDEVSGILINYREDDKSKFLDIPGDYVSGAEIKISKEILID